jgi:hypothetical protein
MRFCILYPSHRFIVQQIYVRWWEKYIVDTNDYPKMIIDCNLVDPQTRSPFVLQKIHNQDKYKQEKSKKELKKQLQDAFSQISNDSDEDQEPEASQNSNYFQDSQDPYDY